VRRVRHAGGVLVIEERGSRSACATCGGRATAISTGVDGGAERRAEAVVRRAVMESGTVRRVFASAGLAVESLWGDFDRRPFTAAARRIDHRGAPPAPGRR
jgi:hypothetical protein